MQNVIRAFQYRLKWFEKQGEYQPNYERKDWLVESQGCNRIAVPEKFPDAVRLGAMKATFPAKNLLSTLK
jgi:hypothetical protein